MLWSLIKIITFVVFVMVATYAATLLLEMDGSATIDIGGQAATFTVIEMVIGLIVLVGLVWLAFARAKRPSPEASAIIPSDNAS